MNKYGENVSEPARRFRLTPADSV